MDTSHPHRLPQDSCVPSRKGYRRLKKEKRKKCNSGHKTVEVRGHGEAASSSNKSRQTSEGLVELLELDPECQHLLNIYRPIGNLPQEESVRRPSHSKRKTQAATHNTFGTNTFLPVQPLAHEDLCSRKDRKKKKRKRRLSLEEEHSTADLAMDGSLLLRRKPEKRKTRCARTKSEQTDATAAEDDSEREEPELDDNDLCAICYEILIDPHKVVPCTHTFCKVCLGRLQLHVRSATTPCPMCRATISHCVFEKELTSSLKTKYPKTYSDRLAIVNPLYKCRLRLPNATRQMTTFSPHRGRQRDALRLRRAPDFPFLIDDSIMGVVLSLVPVFACSIFISLLVFFQP
ncbi:LON peptidase N-terminal domain and RING finger protein 3 isoform X3 [Aplysia californica]|uniref:LON peptidase N-terminal domain and RING finger protein 3 isoform X3 n=1 Tax=Aplysia californica TaxID=6500 RepID=A0ABM1A649_APLCA|nr:LON peptidase N-terminal domain and RING finger protein 3 isoform X3 [Aplysia californica]